MFYSESILNRSVKSFLLTLSLFSYELYGALPAVADPAGAATTLAIEERPQQFEKAQPLPLPRFSGQVAISATVGTLAGATAFNLLTATSVLSFAQRAIAAAGMTDFFMPTDIAYVGGGLVGLGTAAALLYKLRRLEGIARQNAQNQNAAVQVAAGLAQAVYDLQQRQHAIEQALKLQQATMQNLQTGQTNLETQIDLRAEEITKALANLALSQEQRFAAADQARAKDTQRLQEQAAAHHEASKVQFGDLQRQLNALPGATVQAILAALESQRLAQQQEKEKRALPANQDAAAPAEEVQPLSARMESPWAVYFFGVHSIEAFMSQRKPMAATPADPKKLNAADELD